MVRTQSPKRVAFTIRTGRDAIAILAGYEGMAMITKVRVRNIGAGDIKAQATFIAGLFQVAA